MKLLIGLFVAALLNFSQAANAEWSKKPNVANDAAFGQFMLNAAHWQDPQLWEQSQHSTLGWGNASWITGESIWRSAARAEAQSSGAPTDIFAYAAEPQTQGWGAALAAFGAEGIAEELSDFITPSYVSEVTLTPLLSFEEVGFELQVDF